MAVLVPLKFPTFHTLPKIATRSQHLIPQFEQITLKVSPRSRRGYGRGASSLKLGTTRAIEEGRKETQSETASLIEPIQDDKATEPEIEVSEIGKEIKKAMEERKEKSTNDLFSGVLEEVREIEWPAFQKVLGTTGVVLGVIAGSSVVLLTLNAVLAELSDKVFAGRGVQDFFS